MIILGSRGMLGSMMAEVIPEAELLNRPDFDAETDMVEGDNIINCIGIIKPYCEDVPRAIQVNALFPHTLPYGTIQIATDCVYTGSKGSYVESDPHDALDVYGKTKSLGEAPQLKNLRCSIIGPEVQNHVSLLDWFLSQDEANGFTNHLWNGLTTYAFAKICRGIIDSGMVLPNLQHLVPADIVSKCELLEIIAKAYNKDIAVHPVEAPEEVNRTLSTSNPKLNKRIWEAAGYEKIPTIEEMITEMAQL